MTSTFIYALCDPDTDMVRYIGKTNNVNFRFKRHLNDTTKTYKTNWINVLKSQGKIPNLKIIEEINKDNWEESEKKWINYYRNLNGDLLTNTTDGGECGAKKGFRKGHIVSEETRKKISIAGKGRKPTIEENRKRSESMKNLNPEIKNKIISKLKLYLKTRIISPETRAKLSKHFKGQHRSSLSQEHKDKIKNSIIKYHKSPEYLSKQHKPLSPETRKKISEALIGYKRSDEQKKNMSEAQKKVTRLINKEQQIKMQSARK
jgi:hypothetical protein